MLASRIQRIGFSPTLAINDLARNMRAEGVNVLDFSAGEPDFPTPEAVKAAGKRAIDADETRYTATAGIRELRVAIAEKLLADRGLTYDPAEILVSPGAKASLYFACMALLDTGDEVLVPTPYWTSYPEQIRLAGAEPLFVDCDERTGFKLTAERLEGAVTPRSKAIILNYPSNPTGACYGRQELAALAGVCKRRGLWVIADEIYSKLVYGQHEFTSIVQAEPEMRGRTVLIDGMSKTYAMTGWRVGYAAGPQDLISAMAKLQSHSTSNTTSISQWASLEALSLSDDELAPRLREFERRRDEIVSRLQALHGISCVTPQGAFYVFPNVSGCFRDGDGHLPLRNGQDFSRYLLEEARVAVVPGEAFGSPRHVRLSYAVSLERVREGMDRIAQALSRFDS